MAKDLDFESSANDGFKAVGFGRDATHGGHMNIAGYNADKTDYSYNAKTGQLKIEAALTGHNSQTMVRTSAMSAEKAAVFSTVMDNALETGIKKTYGNVASYDELKGEFGAINSNALKGLLTDAKDITSAVMQSDSIKEISTVMALGGVKFEAASDASNNKHFNSGDPHLQGTHKLQGPDGHAVYLKEDGKQLWDPKLDNGDGDWVKGDSNKLIAHASKSLGLEKEMAPRVAAHKSATTTLGDIKQGHSAAIARVTNVMGKDKVAQTKAFDATAPASNVAIATADQKNKNGPMGIKMGMNMAPSPAA